MKSREVGPFILQMRGSGTPRALLAGGGVRTRDRDEGWPVPAGGFMAACCARTALLRCSARTPGLLGSSRPLPAASPLLPHRGARHPRARGTLGKRLSARRRASGARMRAALRTNGTTEAVIGCQRLVGAAAKLPGCCFYGNLTPPSSLRMWPRADPVHLPLPCSF